MTAPCPERLRRGGVALIVGTVALAALAGCGTSRAVAALAGPGVVQHVDLTFAGGAVRGGVVRIPVHLGSTVDLTVHSDVADEVHLHGYNRLIDVTAGSAASLQFVADTPGVFDVEMEQRGSQLTQLEIS